MKYQFIYTTNETDQDENYYNYMDNNNPLTNTDNDNNPSYPSHNTPSPFPYSLAHPTSPENTYTED